MTQSTPHTADVVVVGAGPAGRAVSARLIERGVGVVLVDPAPEARWRATYACWSDELPSWLDRSQALAAEVPSVLVRGRRDQLVSRAYAVFDTTALQRCLAIDAPPVIPGKAVEVGARRVRLADGSTLNAAHVVDARGAIGPGPRQTAWGIVVARTDARPALGDADAVLMDWRGTDANPDGAEPATPSFLYAVPLDAERVLLEETCLAGDPPLSPSVLRERLVRRLAALGIDAAAALDIEKVSFRLTGIGRSPWRDSAAVLFGARAGMMHPASGYSVAAALTAADDFADAVAAGENVLQRLWPRNTRRVHRLRAVGLRTLLAFDAADTVAFFDDFFALPVERQRTYLSDRTDAAGVAAAMAALFRASDNRRRLVLAQSTLKFTAH